MQCDEGDSMLPISGTHEYPTWTFPAQDTSPITVGTLNGAHFTEPEGHSAPEIDFQHNHGWGPPLRATSYLALVAPPARIWERPLAPFRVERNVERMVRYYEANNYHSFIPRDLLRDYLTEGFQVERENYMYDPFSGNLLDIYSPQANNEAFLAYPHGKCLNELHLRRLPTPADDDGPSSFHPIVRLSDPILQIVSSKAPTASSISRLLALRNHSSITIVTMSDLPSEGAPISVKHTRVVDSVSFRRRPLHIAFSTALPTEAAIILDGGELCLWDGRRILGSRISILATYSDTAINYPHRWKACEYGAHPRTLLVGHVDRLDSLDFRSRAIVPATVYHPPALERITAFQRDPDHPFQSVITTSSRTVLVDCRYSNRPLLEWALQENRDPPAGLQYIRHSTVASDGSSTFLTWSAIRAEITAYSYTCARPIRLIRPAFYDHYAPSMALPPMSSSQPVLLQSFCLHPLVTNSLNSRSGSWLGQRSLQDKESAPQWPPLRGVVPFVRKSGMDLFQISHDGALYVQRHGFAKSGDKQGFVRPEMHEEQLAVYACATTEVMRHQSDPTLLKDHEKFNWSTLVKFLDWAAIRPVDGTFPNHVADSQRQGALITEASATPGPDMRNTLFDLFASRVHSPVSYSEDGTPLPRTFHHFRSPDMLAQTVVQYKTDGSCCAISYPDLLPNSDEVSLETIERKLASLFPTSAVEGIVASGEDVHRPTDLKAKRELSMKFMAQQAYLASQVIGTARRNIESVELDEEHDTSAEGHSAPVASQDSDGETTPMTRPGSLLQTPYSSTPLRISAAAMELRKRWTDADRFYGQRATMNPVSGAPRAISRERPVKREGTADTYYSSATEGSSVPTILNNILVAGSVDSGDWASSVPSQAWFQPQVQTAGVSSSQGSNAYSQPVGDASWALGSARKKKARRKGF